MIQAGTRFAPSILSQMAKRQEAGADDIWPVPDLFNIADMCCDRWAVAQPDRVALIDVRDDAPPKHWTYAELLRAATKLAHYFKSHHIVQGDRIAVLLPQGPEVLIAHFAAYRIGAIILPLFTLFGPDALAYRLRDSGAKLIITDAGSLNKLVPILPDLPELERILVCGLNDKDTDKQEKTVSVCSFWAELEHMPNRALAAVSGPDDPAMLIYTSGTTGNPKGALHAHRFLLGHLPNIEISHQGFPRAGDKGWTPADWAWIGGLMDLALPCLYYGVPLVSYRQLKFDPEATFQFIADHQIRNMFLPPTALKLMRSYHMTAERLPVLSVRTIASGGEALGSSLLGWARKILNVEVNEIYGQTECNLVICTDRSVNKTVPDGVMGKAVPGHKLCILKPDGHEAEIGDVGEIAVQAPDPVMFLGYWNKPEDTQEKIKQGWLLTGDLGRQDENGFFSFVARNDDIITSSGYRIGPTEIENCLMQHPSVSLAAVIGLPDPIRTETVTACIVLSTGTGSDQLAENLKQLVRERLSAHLVPHQIIWIDDLPLTATGKIRRKALKESLLPETDSSLD